MNPADLFRKVLQDTKELLTPSFGAFQKPQNQTETQVNPPTVDNPLSERIKPFLSVLSKNIGISIPTNVGLSQPADMFRKVLADKDNLLGKIISGGTNTIEIKNEPTQKAIGTNYDSGEYVSAKQPSKPRIY